MTATSRLAPSLQGSTVAPDRLRGQQITAIARWTPAMAGCSLITCAAVVTTFWNTAPRAYLVGLLLSLTTLHGLSVFGARRWLAAGHKVASARMRWARVAFTVLIAVAWSTMPAMLMPTATPDQRQLLIYVGAGLISASVMLAPLLPAALSFAGVITLGVLLPMPLLHQSITVQHALTLITFCALTSSVVWSQSIDFAQRVLNEITLGEQGEVIGLLLREFEENALDFLWEADAELRLHRVSDRLAQIMGCPPALLEGGSVIGGIKGGSCEAGEEGSDTAKILACLAERVPFRDMQVVIALEGQLHWLVVSGKPVFDGQGRFQGFRGVGSDITAAHRSDERIAYLARYDSLTDLPNRTLFQEALFQACAQTDRFAVLCLDLDGFKAVNDTFGHSTGDALLAAVAGRLRTSVREGDVVARLGGDEFAVLQAGGDAESAAFLAQRLIERVAEPFQIGGASPSVGVSIGIATECIGLVADDLLRTADTGTLSFQG